MEYSFKYSLTKDEFVDFNTYTLWFAPWEKKVRLTFAIRLFIYCGVAMAVTIFIMMKINPPMQDNHSIMIIMLILLDLFITYIYYQQAPNSIKKKTIKFLQKEENQHLLDEAELNLNDEHIISTDNLSTTNYSWKSIVRYVITKDVFYLYINSIQAIVIPKRLLKDQKEIEDLDKLITEKIPLLSSFRSI